MTWSGVIIIRVVGRQEDFEKNVYEIDKWLGYIIT